MHRVQYNVTMSSLRTLGMAKASYVNLKCC